MSFISMNLDPNISKAISICGYTSPTPIQSKCIPDIILGKDLVASAQTGTGKTAAFVLPALQKLSLQQNASKPRVLILTPTRELATQIKEAASKYGKFLRFRMTSLVGGMSYRQQIRDLSRAVDIIIATPGRLMDHLDSGRVDLSGIQMLILDEADRMLDMGFIDDVQRIAGETPSHRQTLLFSATVDKQLSHIVRHLLKDPIRVDVAADNMAPAQITQQIYLADNPAHRMKLLRHFLQNGNIFKGVIFCGTKIGTDRLAAEIMEMGFNAAPLHGDLKQSIRNRTIDQLRRGKIQFLVATDVAARGIDISDVTHVINYDLPRFSEDYVHRIGRTGRAGKLGVAMSLVLPMDMRHLQRIERYTNQKISREVVLGLEPKQSPTTSSGKKKKSFGPKKEHRQGDKKRFDARKGERREESRSGERKFNARQDGRRGDVRNSERKFGDRKSERYKDSKDTKKEYRYRGERVSAPVKKEGKEKRFAGAKSKKTFKRERY